MFKKIIITSLAICCLAQAIPAQAAVSNPLAARLSGRIILAVQGNGSAWYVNPANLKRYPLVPPFKIISALGVGISNKDLAKIPLAGSTAVGDKNFIARVKGKIFIQVQDRGQAWYINPQDGKRYELNSSANILSLIRKFGLGISNDNLSKIVSAAPAVVAVPAVKIPATAGIPYDLNYLEQKINDLVNAQRVANSLPALVWNSDIAAVARAHSQELASENTPLTSLNKVCDYFIIHHESLIAGAYQDSRLSDAGINYFSSSGENIDIQGGKEISFFLVPGGPNQQQMDACTAAVEMSNEVLKASLESNISTPDKLNLIKAELVKRGMAMASEQPAKVDKISYLSNDEMAADIVNGWMNSPGHRANILQPIYNESGIGVAYVNGYIIATQDFIKHVSCGYRGAVCCEPYTCLVPYSCQQNNFCE
jgi:uncharacterized protein YkwD